MSSTSEMLKVVVLDGGSGTSLGDLGHSEIFDECLWSAGLIKTHPDTLLKLHKEFYLAGADVVVTATYQASVEGFIKQFGVSEEEALKLIKKGVELVKTAQKEAEPVTGRRLFVAASVGPYGAILCDRSEYHGQYVDNMTKEELSRWHSSRLDAIIAGCPDLLAIETIPSLMEAEAILQCIDQKQHKCWLTFTLKDSYRTAHGEDIREAISTVARHDNVVAVGANCFNMDYVEGFLDYMKGLPLNNKQLIVKPNGGIYKPDGWDKTSFLIHERTVDWVNKGARWIGGCCGTNFQDISRILKALNEAPNIRFHEKDAHLY